MTPISFRKRAGILAFALTLQVGAHSHSETVPIVDLAPGTAKTYADQIHPLLVKACGECHGENPKKNDLTLTSLATARDILSKHSLLEDIAERVSEGDMPPKKAKQPSPSEREQLLAWISGVLETAASAKSGDPGPVTLRRLSNVAYDNAVRDLTGVDILPTQAGEFPPDSVGGGGFCQCRRCDADQSWPDPALPPSRSPRRQPSSAVGRWVPVFVLLGAA